MKTLALFAAIVAVVETSAPVQAADWGTLKGQIVVEGTAPTPPPLVVQKDAFCIAKKPPNDAIVIGKGNALVNAVVYLRVPTGQKVDVAPQYAAQMNQPVVLDNKGCEFHPHVTLVRVGQTLAIKNSDPVGHNTNVSLLGFNQVIPAGAKPVDVKVGVASPLPSEINCNIHPFMKGYVLAQDHPYMATTDQDGKFEIKDIPAGKHEFQFWQESTGYLKNLKLKGGTTDRRGRAQLTIPAGGTLDLGEIKVPASSFK
jgi:plastocyanin